MCGICGFSNLSGAGKKKDLLEMTKTLAHRGPDGEGVFWREGIALGHRRLAIIDKEGGHQPMSDIQKNLWLSFNGEIYNFKKLRERFQKSGYRFRTEGDTETILAAYREFGLKFVDHLEGMFAFALYDSKQKKLILARDRLGVKPLYWGVFAGEIIFASEIKAILKHPLVKRELNPLAVSSYLSYRYPLGKETFFKNIFSLEPGYLLIFDKGKIKKTKYWDLPVVLEKEDKGEDYYILKIRDYLRSAVENRIVADVPVGAILSGGLDSTIITALMSSASKNKVKTYSVGFREKGYDESIFSKLVSREFSSEHHKLILSPQRYFSQIANLIKIKDAPLSVPNEVALSCLAQKMKKKVTVVLSAEGADELFGGYGRIFRSPYDLQRLNNTLPLAIKRILFSALFKKYGTPAKTYLDHFLFNYHWFSDDEKSRIIKKDFFSQLETHQYPKIVFEEIFNKIKNLPPEDQYLYVFQKIHLLGLLHRLDSATMAWGVEARAPFTDHRLVELVNQIPFKYKIKWNSRLAKIFSSFSSSDTISERFDITKYILKKSYKNEVPAQIIKRKKMPFPIPLDQWLKARDSWAKEILLSSKTKIVDPQAIELWLKNLPKKDFGMKLWMLASLEIWAKEYL